jgi:hypothetical protein
MFGPRPFEEAEAELHGLVQDEFGDIFAILPMIGLVNGGLTPDRSRKSFFVSGVFCDEARDANLHLEDMRFSTTDPHVTFRRCDLKFPIRPRDLIKRCKTGIQYEVKETKPDTYSGLCCHLNIMGVIAQ